MHSFLLPYCVHTIQVHVMSLECFRTQGYLRRVHGPVQGGVLDCHTVCMCVMY